MSFRVLVVDTYYSEFLSELYAGEPSLAERSFGEQRERLFAAAFGVSDAYPHFLREAGGESEGFICNADVLQKQWAKEHGLTLAENPHDMRRQIVAAQIDSYRPDVLYVFEWSPLGDVFLREMQSKVRLVVGQIASPLPPNRTFSGYQMMISSWPPIVDYFRKEGVASATLRLGFDPRIGKRLSRSEPKYDVSFVGGFAASHPDRVQWLEHLLKHVDVAIFGYGLERVPNDSPIHEHHRGSVWGWKMYETLQQSKITLNRHAWIDVRGSVATHLATNMRLYEATGVGTCLLTDAKENLAELFVPGREVLTYADEDECAEMLRRFLSSDVNRDAVAKAGQARTMSEHGYDLRMKELMELLRSHL